jgi:glycosyltransferase involved in cell wall biosynthesis
VVIPLYNHAEFVGAALESVLAQTSPADEIIVIDDGSSDGGIAVAETILARQSIARVYRQQNRGAHATINRLVSLSRGEFVAILNSDDAFDPMKLEHCRRGLNQAPGTSLICGAVRLIDESGCKLTAGPEAAWLDRARTFREKSGLLQLAILNENFVATTSNMVFSRQLWRDVGGFQSLRYCHDLDFLMAAFARGSVVVDEKSVHTSYRVHKMNTIKGDAREIQLEMAAVVAMALCESGPKLLDPDLGRRGVQAYYHFLRNKKCLELISLFQTIIPGFPDRAAFFRFVTDPMRRAELIELD